MAAFSSPGFHAALCGRRSCVNAPRRCRPLPGPKAFRDFLLSAPHLFLELGEKMGAISHIVSFWRYRFRKGVPPRADADELCAIFQDFESGFAAGLPAGMAA